MIYRTFTTTVAEIVEGKIENGQLKQVKLPDLEIQGKVNTKKIRKEIEKKYPTKTIHIIRQFHQNDKYKIPIKKFKKYGEKYE